MRRYLASVVFAAAIGSGSLAAAPADTTETNAAPVAVQQVRVPIRRLSDEAAMVLVGTALIALGAAVRRAA